MKLVKEHINEKFTEDSDPISDMGIGLISLYFNVIKSRTDTYHFIEKGPHFVYFNLPTTYTYTITSGNIYRRHPRLWAAQEIRSTSKAFLKKNPNKTPVPNDLKAAQQIILENYLRWRKRVGLSESLNEINADKRKALTKNTTYITDDKNLGLKKRIIAIVKDSNGKSVKICLVNGSYVKSTDPGLGFKEFVEGGHHYVDSYPGYKKYIPEDEIWVDDVFKSKPQEIRSIIQHEYVERNLMKYKGWSYSKAHEYANKKEAHLRSKSLS